jgi:hypothetical protein
MVVTRMEREVHNAATEYRKVGAMQRNGKYSRWFLAGGVAVFADW